MTEIELEKKADEIMLAFNFEKVREHMLKVNWVWNIQNETRTPTIYELKRTARTCLTRAIYEPTADANVGTGGFTAYKLHWGLKLSFELTSS